MAVRYEQLQCIMEQNPDLFEDVSQEITEKFKKWLPKNMHVYRLFVKIALRIKLVKCKLKYSARAIFYIMSWETEIRENSEFVQGSELKFKISHTMSPYVSRLSMKAEPDLKEFFDIKDSPARAKK